MLKELTPPQEFPFEFCKILNTYFEEHLQVAASARRAWKYYV